MQVTTDEIFALVGMKEMELIKLRAQVQAMRAELDANSISLTELRAELEKNREGEKKNG